MATIALYANKVNQMPELVRGIKSAVKDYKEELQLLQKKALCIETSVCNMDDVISSIQSSTKTQEEKVQSFETLEQATEEFIENAVSIDGNVADVINQQRTEFYEKYGYLKPECEKNIWDKMCDFGKSIGERCKEHWDAILTVVSFIVVGAFIAAVIILSVATFGLQVVGIAALVGAFANISGQFIEDCITSITICEWSFSSGEEYFGALFGGAVGGLLTLLTGGNAFIVSSVSAGVSVFFSGHFRNITGTEKKSSLEILYETGINAFWAGFIAKMFPVEIKGITKGRNSFAAVFKTYLTKLGTGSARKFSIKSITKGIVASITDDLILICSSSHISSIEIMWRKFFAYKNNKEDDLVYG